jgi:hypothetical protein
MSRGRPSAKSSRIVFPSMKRKPAITPINATNISAFNVKCYKSNHGSSSTIVTPAPPSNGGPKKNFPIWE